MKAMMIAIKPKFCAKIMNGEKTIEVRKNKALASAIQKLIDEQGYADIYVYCSKSEYLYRTNKGYIASKKPLAVGKGTEYTFAYSDEGKVVFKFRCYKVTEYVNGLNWEYVQHDAASYDDYETILEPSCLTDDELRNYVDDLSFCAIHISDLEIFDEPKHLCDFWNTKKGVFCCPLTKAPQNMCYVEL